MKKDSCIFVDMPHDVCSWIVDGRCIALSGAIKLQCLLDNQNLKVSEEGAWALMASIENETRSPRRFQDKSRVE